MALRRASLLLLGHVGATSAVAAPPPSLCAAGGAAVGTCSQVGFLGWRLCPAAPSESQDCMMLRGEPRSDTFLLEALLHSHADLPEAVFTHIREEMVLLERGGARECDAHAPASFVPDVNCSVPVLGPDDPSAVKFDPQQDDRGCFVNQQSNNNCYDYANDIVTNTFAQPGRGSGVCPPHTRPCVPHTCDDVKKAAVSDGLVWVGADLPKDLPARGHYVSLHIWPNSNFHWLRMDSNKLWSHKPGGSSVRNVDNNGKIISDPSKADVSPWSQHCGYLLATPSKSTITMLSLGESPQALIV
eukprot:CAMPEP_0203879728 /NCGR_PEP_ID=MMETSP0359-20131031/24154_1 /ASSEMBLY_ACC=CAM_ASM_000338 /TAXON_ID=268821 /ORGANISM="Scrippsiella Hangoei, Strain SHTV-5" /LENGTH=299 /DNA_ID=CAMNT_0050799203 /DNA_START=27 /DNA_END=926 /DNA_ORIENTATION=+